MKRNKDNSETIVQKNGGDVFEISLDESEKNKYTIAIPLSYNFEITPLDGKGKSVPVSSITNIGIKTIIEIPGAAAQWKVIVKKPVQGSGDPTGKPKEDGGDENGDGFIDWLCQKAGGEDNEIKEKLQNAKRRIIFRRVGV